MSTEKKHWTFALRVRGVSPESIPMARLAEYLREFAELLGSRSSVHFAGVVKGSAVLRAHVDEQATTDATRRLLASRDGSAPKDVLDRASRIERFMREDGARGEIVRRDGNILYVFEGARRRVEEQPEITISQEGELIGTVMRIGGRDETVPLLLSDADGKFHDLNIKGKELAKQIAAYLYGAPIRLLGTGTWIRCSDGAWRLDRFLAHGFEPLDDRPISDVLNEIRTIPENGWSRLADPIAEWRKVRGE